MFGHQDYGSVVNFLRCHHYTDVHPLGKGSFGDVLAALSPQKKEVAVKLIKKENLWRIEDEIWPLLEHPHVLPVLDVFPLAEFGLKMFLSPRHPAALDHVVHRGEFLADINGLNRLRKWFREILSGLNYLHTSGFAHMDIKSDNVLITSDDSAVLCDFSGLAITEMKISRLCSPLQYRPPECWHAMGARGVDGVPFDMWTFGLMGLNVMTGHWPSLNMNDSDDWSWDVHVRPVLVKALQEPALSVLMRRAMPSTNISSQDVHDALHFLLSVMRIVPAERPTAKEASNHCFLRNAGLDLSFGDVQQWLLERQEINTPVKMSEEPTITAGGDFENAAFQPESDSPRGEMEVPSTGVKGANRKSLGKRIKGWFGKKFRRMFPVKNYVILSNDSST